MYEGNNSITSVRLSVLDKICVGGSHIDMVYVYVPAF